MLQYELRCACRFTVRCVDSKSVRMRDVQNLKLLCPKLNVCQVGVLKPFAAVWIVLSFSYLRRGASEPNREKCGASMLGNSFYLAKQFLVFRGRIKNIRKNKARLSVGIIANKREDRLSNFFDGLPALAREWKGVRPVIAREAKDRGIDQLIVDYFSACRPLDRPRSRVLSHGRDANQVDDRVLKLRHKRRKSYTISRYLAWR